jgi:hypothetical protein
MTIKRKETNGAKIISCFFFAPFVSSGFILVLGFSSRPVSQRPCRRITSSILEFAFCRSILYPRYLLAIANV